MTVIRPTFDDSQLTKRKDLDSLRAILGFIQKSQPGDSELLEYQGTAGFNARPVLIRKVSEDEFEMATVGNHQSHKNQDPSSTFSNIKNLSVGLIRLKLITLTASSIVGPGKDRSQDPLLNPEEFRAEVTRFREQHKA